MAAPTARARLLLGNPEFRAGEGLTSGALADLAVANYSSDNVSVLPTGGN